MFLDLMKVSNWLSTKDLSVDSEVLEDDEVKDSLELMASSESLKLNSVQVSRTCPTPNPPDPDPVVLSTLFKVILSVFTVLSKFKVLLWVITLSGSSTVLIHVSLNGFNLIFINFTMNFYNQ